MSLRELATNWWNKPEDRSYGVLWRTSNMTMFHMVLVSSDDSREPVDGQHSSLDEACRKAFQIAAEAARPGWRSGAAKPLRVNVYRGDEFELSVEVAHQDRAASNAIN